MTCFEMFFLRSQILSCILSTSNTTYYEITQAESIKK